MARPLRIEPADGYYHVMDRRTASARRLGGWKAGKQKKAHRLGSYKARRL
jgi:chloramphenicol 3-O-phosphotransferase